MPSETSHLLTANHNQAVIESLMPRLDEFSDWVTTIAFYKALHIVEAVFANDRPVRHGLDHNHRAHMLKSEKRYNNIYQYYRPLYAASITARYLGDGSSNFQDCYTVQDVRQLILGHYLRQIEKSATKFLTSSNILIAIDSLLVP